MKHFLLLFAFLLPAVCSSQDNGKINSVLQGDSIGIFFEQLPYHQGYFPDTVSVFWTCDPFLTSKLFRKDMEDMGDTVWFHNTGYWIGFARTTWCYPCTSSYPAGFANNTGLSAVSLSTPSIIVENDNRPYLDVDFQHNSGQSFTMGITTNAVYTRVMIMHPFFGQVHYSNHTSQDFTVQRQLQSGPYQIWIRVKYPNSCKASFLWRSWLWIN